MTLPTGESSFRRLEDLHHVWRSAAHSRYRRTLEDLGVSPQGKFRHKLKALLPRNLWPWISSYLKYAFKRRHPFPDYSRASDDGVYPLASDGTGEGAVRVAIAGDWASGTEESDRVARHMGRFDPHFTIHLGDVYYVGDPDEVRENVLGEPAPGVKPVAWPQGSRGTFALNGNHEMYANGNAYFDILLPRLGMRDAATGTAAQQRASFFCLQNDFWLLIGIDTGYNSVGVPVLSQIPLIKNIPIIGGDCHLEKKHRTWLRTRVAPLGRDRGVMLLSHHQYYSAFDDEYRVPGRQLAEFFGRPVLWFWGHEHRLAIYEEYGFGKGVRAYGRCVGNGGMPVPLQRPKRERGLKWHDGRRYASFGSDQVGYNGYATLVFERATLAVEYRDLNGTLLATERWRTANGQLELLHFDRGPE
jgi:hypothetical protein